MPIVSGDLAYHYSTKLASQGYTLGQSNPNESLGGHISISGVRSSPTLHNLFDVVTGDENAASDVEYRCVFFVNKHASLALQSSVVWLANQVAGGATAAIGLDPSGIVPSGRASAQAVTVANESSAPAGVSFSSPSTKGAGLAIGDITAGYCQAIWIRRTAANTAALNNDGCTIRVEGDTAE
jgi:hypothetical protein